MVEPVEHSTDEERQQRLEAVLAAIARRFGPAVVYRLCQASPDRPLRAIPTGSFTLDRVTGIGGIPRGRLTELSGPPSSGKRTLVAHIVANAQANGGYVAYIDAAHGLSADRLHRCGANLQDLLLAVPESDVEALTMVELLVQSGGLDAVILDALPFTQHLVLAGSSASMLSRGLTRIVAALRGVSTAVVIVQELPGFDSQARSGRRSLRHAAALRLLLWPEAPLLHASGLVTGLRVRAQVLRNALTFLTPTVTFELDDRVGIRRSAEVLDSACAAGLVISHPLGLLAGDIVLGRNRAQAAARLEAEPTLRTHLEGQLGAYRLP